LKISITMGFPGSRYPEIISPKTVKTLEFKFATAKTVPTGMTYTAAMANARKTAQKGIPVSHTY
jgi:hypothetical protein